MKYGIEYKDSIINRPSLFIVKCVIWAAGIIIGVYLVEFQSWWAGTLGGILIAAMFTHGIELEHQALHCNLLTLPHWLRVLQLVWVSWISGNIGRPEAVRAFHERIADRILHSNDSHLALIQGIINRKDGYA